MGFTKKEQKQLTKDALYGDFNGLCALCGYELGERWHIWDIEPSQTIVKKDGSVILGNPAYENKLPACHSCHTSRYHHSHDKNARIDLETFREALYHEYWFLSQHSTYSTYFNRAIKFGLIKETGKEIVFHFEKMGR